MADRYNEFFVYLIYLKLIHSFFSDITFGGCCQDLVCTFFFLSDVILNFLFQIYKRSCQVKNDQVAGQEGGAPTLGGRGGLARDLDLGGGPVGYLDLVE